MIGQLLKNKNMAEQLTEQKDQIYVWTKTERAGDIVTFDKVDGEFTLFTDGTKVFSNIIPELLMEAKDISNAKVLATPFKSTIASTGPEPIDETPVKATPQPVTQNNAEVNVMLEMLRKLSAKNSIEMPLQLNVPSHEVYELFKDQMDITKSDLNEQILALVMSQIDNLQEQLKPQAEEFIKSYYDGRKRTNTRSKSTTESGPDITY